MSTLLTVLIFNRYYLFYIFDFKTMDYEFEKYSTTTENLKKTLELYRVAIIPYPSLSEIKYKLAGF